MSSHPAIPHSISASPTPSSRNYCGALHNYLQEKKDLRLLSWAEVMSAPPNPVRWTVHCKGGKIMGIGIGVQKTAAKQAAAKQAWAALCMGP